MLETTHTAGVEGRLSLQPLADVLRAAIHEGKPGAAALYTPILRELDLRPELLEAHDDATLLLPHAETVETLLSTLFPPGTSATDDMYAVAIPFKHETIYSSAAFRDRFMEQNSNCIHEPDADTNRGIAEAKERLAFNLILRQFYHWDLPATASSVHPFTDRDCELTSYLELNLDARFVKVSLKNPDFVLPAEYTAQRSLDLNDLYATFPLKEFCFEGLIVIHVNDVTADQAIAEIKNTLLNVRSFSDSAPFDALQRHVQTFLGLPHITVGITPFYQIDGQYHFSELHYRHSLLFRNLGEKENKDVIAALCREEFEDSEGPLLFNSIRPEALGKHPLLPYYYNGGARSLLLCPLRSDDGRLIGLLEIAGELPGSIRYAHRSRIGAALPLFTLALEKSLEALEQDVDRIIKEHFTAIQPAVEWKFTEAAFEYLQRHPDDDGATLPAITFPDVYPLYAQIDVRNSSAERSTAIRKDLAEQLSRAGAVLQKAGRLEFPLLKAVRYRMERYLEALEENLLSDDEMQLYDFLQGDVQAVMLHLRESRPDISGDVDDYLQSIDPQKKILYHHRRDYEESITRINEALDRFIDREQAQMQKVYPHYFERYVTDGIEFNMYVGQSLAPQKPFHEIYVSNLKLWQLTLLTRAARLTGVLEKRLALPLQTTQLILAHSVPITISFRRKERKFDVDGAYNIRYEIVKKRIDKVHTRAGERLTQPGTVAIVYSQQKELNEYLGYVEYLRAEGLLDGEPEYHDLEDLQGISGLKAIRLRVARAEEDTEPRRKEEKKVVRES